MAGKCRDCAQFRNDPAYLEAALRGINIMSSAWGSTRAEDGLCLRHDCYLSAESSCRDFTPLLPVAAAPAR
jgi:hypothetical protein